MLFDDGQGNALEAAIVVITLSIVSIASQADLLVS
jgi:hypothetical protein